MATAKHDDIYSAIKAQDARSVVRLLKKGDVDPELPPPLALAARSGNLNLVQAMIRAGCAPDENYEVGPEYDDRGTPLVDALRCSQFEVAKYLIRNGADVNATYSSCQRDSPEFFFGFYDLASRSGTCLTLVLQAKGHDMLTFMLGHGLDLNAEVNEGLTHLGWAIEKQDSDAVVLLVQHGAGLDVASHVEEYMGSDNNMLSPLAHAIWKCGERKGTGDSVRICETLLRAGSPIHKGDDSGRSCLDLALDVNIQQLDDLFGLKHLRDVVSRTREEDKQARLFREQAEAFVAECRKVIDTTVQETGRVLDSFRIEADKDDWRYYWGEGSIQRDVLEHLQWIFSERVKRFDALATEDPHSA